MEPFVPIMTPTPGQRRRCFVGDRLVFNVADREGKSPPRGWRALLRTNLGRAREVETEILKARARGALPAGSSWRDIPMTRTPTGWTLDLALAETGYFRAKAYLLDAKGWQHWTEGPDFGVSVHPDFTRTANILYCAFPRMFGELAPTGSSTAQSSLLRSLDEQGYAVIPPSGKLRDLAREIPHIVERLGCRILHLLPVNPVPTTFARFGRFGSPYAALDLAAVDPALVVFDKRTTGVDQFRELTYAAHSAGARVLLDIAVNHTGWGSVLQENHPEWFLRNSNGEFKSPGAWGVTWEDLVELKHVNVELWDALAGIFVEWCRRGVDGFRCDAGYMVPTPAWQYITARVRQEFPNAVFLLEGLGGAWEATEALLTEGGMQWAYSELFQNYSGSELSRYLDHSVRASAHAGLLVHYSETHDNPRLAARGRTWSLMRNRLCALASDSGGFGFTCGVEWLATEKIRVHDRVPMNWGAAENIIEELARLNRLLAEHPAFFDGATIERLSPPESPVVALCRKAANGIDTVLVLVNSDTAREQALLVPDLSIRKTLGADFLNGPHAAGDLLGTVKPVIAQEGANVKFTLGPGAAHCLGQVATGLSGNAYRDARARSAWAVQALGKQFQIEEIGAVPWEKLSALVDRNPARFLAAISSIDLEAARTDLERSLEEDLEAPHAVVEWSALDANRITLVPPGHWVLVRDTVPFRARLDGGPNNLPVHVESTPAAGGHIASFHPQDQAFDATIDLERYDPEPRCVTGKLRFLPAEPLMHRVHRDPLPEDLVLLTNGRGGMARICVDLGRVTSKYDCVLGANLHPEFPVDRHIFVKRIRVWVNADGFISPLNGERLVSFRPGPPAVWRFVAAAGDGRTVEIEMRAAMPPEYNTTVFSFSRPAERMASGKQLPAECDVRLTVRFDIEDRNFHTETHRNGGAEFHLCSNTRPLPPANPTDPARGFEFAPAPDRRVRVLADAGMYHPQEEWSQGIAHPIEQSRGQVGHGDAVSPGWFELPLPKGSAVTITVTADPNEVGRTQVESCLSDGQPNLVVNDEFSRALLRAASAYVVRRGAGKTIIAGYPWFLDWGRDTFIAARGLISAGYTNDVTALVRTFARFEKDGTLPNTIHGEDASNRDTSDAPLWLALVCEELAGVAPAEAASLLSSLVDDRCRSLRDVLESIARHYATGTPNGIRMDPESGLIWSPSHFTWMDTNYPAGTPREGYPVEIQALWVRLLRFLSREGSASLRAEWNAMAERAIRSIRDLFWLEEQGWFADVLIARPGQSARGATKDDALRSNALFLVSLGIDVSDRAKRYVAKVTRHLLVPGGIRTLAPLGVNVPLPIRGNYGQMLNDPYAPYWGRYEGDEDTRRKPAYHNGTAWVWTLPNYCEALARAWDFCPQAVRTAKAYLGSAEKLLLEGCLGQLPEILDGDAPHNQRGCDAQAWSVTETLRVWLLLSSR